MLVNHLRGLWPNAEFYGCTGPKMRTAGVRTVVDASSLAVVGLLEADPRGGGRPPGPGDPYGFARLPPARRTQIESAWDSRSLPGGAAGLGVAKGKDQADAARNRSPALHLPFRRGVFS
jgi:hypothetical protein